MSSRFACCVVILSAALFGGCAKPAEPEAPAPTPPAAPPTAPTAPMPTPPGAPAPGATTTADAGGEQVWRAKCGTCHILYEPDKVKKSGDEWAATVDEMITKRKARLTPAERDQVVGYLRSVAG